MTIREDDRRDARKLKFVRYCSQPVAPPRPLPAELGAHRTRLIRTVRDKWVNGTVLHYYFFDKKTDGSTVTLTDGSTEFRPWATTNKERDVVRRALPSGKV